MIYIQQIKVISSFIAKMFFFSSFYSLVAMAIIKGIFCLNVLILSCVALPANKGKIMTIIILIRNLNSFQAFLLL